MRGVQLMALEPQEEEHWMLWHYGSAQVNRWISSMRRGEPLDEFDEERGTVG